MRITGGEFSGRRIKEPPDQVRPTQDRVREAIFSSLAAMIPGSRVLDLYAGAGTLGLEAWSRGADHVCWVESEPQTCRVLRSNVATFCTDPARRAEVVCTDAFRYVVSGKHPGTYDLIMADPPYARTEEDSILNPLLAAVRDHEWLVSDGFLVFEQSRRLKPVDEPGWALVRDRHYSQTRVLTYRRVPSS